LQANGRTGQHFGRLKVATQGAESAVYDCVVLVQLLLGCRSLVDCSSAAPAAASAAAGDMANSTQPATAVSAARKDGKDAAGAGSTRDAATEDTDDTMRNLRKTFAGIFGDM